MGMYRVDVYKRVEERDPVTFNKYLDALEHRNNLQDAHPEHIYQVTWTNDDHFPRPKLSTTD